MNKSQLRAAYVVYQINAPKYEPTRPFFIGCCKLSDIASIPDAWHYVTFAKTIAPADDIKLTILAIVPTLAEATALQDVTAQVAGVWINLHSERGPALSPTRARPVVSLTTGEHWPTASACADALGVSRSAMSNHLNGLAKTVRGQRFEWLDKANNISNT